MFLIWASGQDLNLISDLILMNTKVEKKDFRSLLQSGIYYVINPVVRFLIRIGLTPNGVTTIGFILNIGVAVIFIMGAEKGNRLDLSYVGWGGALVLFAGIFDMLDGQVARLGNMKSESGALFDSVLDRYSELVTFLGICYYLVSQHYFLSSLFAFIALIGSMMVSYTRARAEGLGVECKGGLMQRPERVVLIGLSGIACGISASILGGDYKLFVPGIPFHVFETMSVFTIPITIMAMLTNITAFNRLRQAKNALDLREFGPVVKSGKKLPLIAFILLSSLLFFPGTLSTYAGSSAAGKLTPGRSVSAVVYPVPSGIGNMLFYLQRDPNTNTIICQLNTNSKGEVDPSAPVNVFWMRYDEGGEKKELNLIQRKFAYGISSRKISADRYELNFVSYKKYLMYLVRSKDNKYRVYAPIGKKQVILKKVFVRIDGGTFWVPNVKYVELTGVDPATGEEVSERITA